MASQSTAEAALISGDDAAIYKQLEDYDWPADTEFQSGLQAILGSTADLARAEHLTLRARCFFFSRKRNIHIDFNQYLEWRVSQSSIPAVNGASSNPSELLANLNIERRASVAQHYDSAPHASEPPAPYPTSFEQIVELISTGQPIPGIKDVPNTVLEGQASQTSAAKRKKPWEKDDTAHGGSENSEGMAVNA